MEYDKNTQLGIVTEIGTFGTMGIKDQTVKMVDDIRQVAMETTDPDLKAFLESQLNQ